MKTIELSSNQKAIVDEESFEYLKQFNWYFDGKYAARALWNRETKKETKIYMHRDLLKAEKGKIIDHINGDKLDNRLCNLRFATTQQNSMNQTTRTHPKHSKYKGVSYDKSRNKWIAYCVKDNKMYNLGRVNDEKEAARLYNKKALELHGEFARLNVLEGD
jgi:virulence-associated protein VapD